MINTWKYTTTACKQSGAVGACWAHNPEVDGSKPFSAKIFLPCFLGPPLTTHPYHYVHLDCFVGREHVSHCMSLGHQLNKTCESKRSAKYHYEFKIHLAIVYF